MTLGPKFLPLILLWWVFPALSVAISDINEGPATCHLVDEKYQNLKLVGDAACRLPTNEVKRFPIGHSDKRSGKIKVYASDWKNYSSLYCEYTDKVNGPLNIVLNFICGPPLKELVLHVLPYHYCGGEYKQWQYCPCANSTDGSKVIDLADSLGEYCYIRNTSVQGVYMPDGYGSIDCLWCCPFHKYSRKEKMCVKCQSDGYPVSSPPNEPLDGECPKSSRDIWKEKFDYCPPSLPIDPTISTATVEASSLKPSFNSPLSIGAFSVGDITDSSAYLSWFGGDYETANVSLVHGSLVRTFSLKKNGVINIDQLEPDNSYSLNVAVENCLETSHCSTLLEFQTLFEIPPVHITNIDKSDDGVLVYWKPCEREDELILMVRLQHGSIDIEKRLKSADKYLHLTEFGDWALFFFYTDANGRNGPLSEHHFVKGYSGAGKTIDNVVIFRVLVLFVLGLIVLLQLVAVVCSRC